MALMSKLAALLLSAAAMINLPAYAAQQAAPTAVPAQAAQAATRAPATPPKAAPSPVPEPVDYKLVLLGLAVLLLIGRPDTDRQKPWSNK
jgi:hypothetical protein